MILINLFFTTYIAIFPIFRELFLVHRVQNNRTNTDCYSSVAWLFSLLEINEKRNENEFYFLCTSSLQTILYSHDIFARSYSTVFFLRQIFSLRLKQINRLKSKQFEKSYRIQILKMN